MLQVCGAASSKSRFLDDPVCAEVFQIFCIITFDVNKRMMLVTLGHVGFYKDGKLKLTFGSVLVWFLRSRLLVHISSSLH